MTRRTGNDLAQLRLEFSAKKSAIRSRLAEFAAVPEAEYFYELVYCLLTPQSSAINAASVVSHLRQADQENRTVELAPLLRQKLHYIRFHNTKARRITVVREQMPMITATIRSTVEAAQLRDWLVDHVNGFGLKEASHFLRNIGRRNLAILDRHILRNLVRYRVIRSMPKTLTPRRYLLIEKRFARFADRSGMTMDELDLLFWSRETGQILK